MASITANGAKGHHKFTLTVTETATSTANNTSTVSFSFKLSPIQTSWDWSGWSSIKYSIKINGTEYTGTIPSYDGSSTVTLKSGTQTVSHNANGTKSISYSFSVTDGAGKSYTPGNASASGKLELTDIPRQANITSAPNFSDEDNPTISYSNSAGNSVTALEACISLDGSSIDIAYRDISKTGTSYTFVLTEAEKNVLINATQSGNSIPVWFFVRTKIGDAKYYSSLKRTFSINDANPIVTASVVDTNEQTVLLTGDNTKLVKYYSNALATMSAEAQKGAAIDENLYIIRNGSNTGYGTEHTFSKVESNVFAFTAEDSRGNIGEAEVTLDMVDYIPLTCYTTNNRPDALGNMTIFCYGDYFNGSFGKEVNTLSVMCRYAETGGTFSNWIAMNITKEDDSYYASADFVISNFSQNKYYTFEACAIDKLDTVYSTDEGIKSIPIFHWGENDFVFEVPVTFNAGVNNGGASGISDDGDQSINGSLNVTGNLRLKGTGNYGNYLLFGDSNYCYIAELTDDVMTIKANKINLNATGGVMVDGYAIPTLVKGIWTPSLNSSAISSYTTQYGWYSKMGQTVSIGFYIKATCKSGYHTTAISIAGLPFTPMYSSAGGGMCSGAYIAGGQDFQCYVAETSGNITIRTQACNNTSSANLTTSASGCWYRSGGGEITLSGTITFISNS